MRIVSIVSGAVLLCASVAAAQTPRTTPAACDALRQLQVAGVALTVTKAEWFAAGAPLPGGRGGAAPVATKLPAYCRLDGVIDRRMGRGRDLWHRLRACAAGGLERPIPVPGWRWAQRIGPERRWARRRRVSGPALARGFAVVSTDTGHQGTRRVRRQLQTGPAGEPRLRLRRDRTRGGGREAHHRAALRQAAGPFVLRGVLDRRPRRRC